MTGKHKEVKLVHEVKMEVDSRTGDVYLVMLATVRAREFWMC